MSQTQMCNKLENEDTIYHVSDHRVNHSVSFWNKRITTDLVISDSN